MSDAERKALAWLSRCDIAPGDLDTWLEASPQTRAYAATIVRAALARDVPAPADEPTTIDARQVGEYVEQDLLAQQRDGAKLDFAATFDRVQHIFGPSVGVSDRAGDDEPRDALPYVLTSRRYSRMLHAAVREIASKHRPNGTPYERQSNDGLARDLLAVALDELNVKVGNHGAGRRPDAPHPGSSVTSGEDEPFVCAGCGHDRYAHDHQAGHCMESLCWCGSFAAAVPPVADRLEQRASDGSRLVWSRDESGRVHLAVGQCPDRSVSVRVPDAGALRDWLAGETS